MPAQDTARDAAGASGQDTAALLEQVHMPLACLVLSLHTSFTQSSPAQLLATLIPACIYVLCSQLDSIRRQIAAQFPGIERELEALDHGALPGTVGHESSARERPELNPSAHRYASTKEHTLRWAFENSQSLFTLLAFCAATRRAAVGA